MEYRIRAKIPFEATNLDIAAKGARLIDTEKGDPEHDTVLVFEAEDQDANVQILYHDGRKDVWTPERVE